MFAASLAAPKASAQTPLLDYTPTFSSSTRTDGPYTVGTLFQVGAVGQTVSALGIQDVNLNGVAAGSQVGLWDSTEATPLGSVTVTTADALVGTYRFHNLGSSIVLAANTQYLIGALVGGGFDHSSMMLITLHFLLLPVSPSLKTDFRAVAAFKHRFLMLRGGFLVAGGQPTHW